MLIFCCFPGGSGAWSGNGQHDRWPRTAETEGR